MKIGRLTGFESLLARRSPITYALKNITESGMVTSWGESQPSGISAGAASYEITLKNVCPESGVDLYALQNFRVVISHAKSKTVYSNCYFKNITDTGGAGNKVCRNAEILAAKRTGDD